MSHVDITDADGKWRITFGFIQDRKTGETRAVAGIPYGSLATMPYLAFMRKVEQAFNSGEWPQPACPTCGHRKSVRGQP